MSLRVRIALISAAAVAIAIFIAALATFSTAKRELIAEIDQSLYNKVDDIDNAATLFELGSALSPFNENRVRGPFDRGERGFDAIYWRFFIDGNIYVFGGDLPLDSFEETVIYGEASSVVRTVGEGDDSLRVLTARIDEGVVQVARSLSELDSKRAAKQVAKELESLRNNLAHAQDVVTHDWAQIARMSARVEGMILGS